VNARAQYDDVLQFLALPIAILELRPDASGWKVAMTLVKAVAFAKVVLYRAITCHKL
jgi:hypothetical protein